MKHESERALPFLPQTVRAGRVPTWNAASTQHRACPVCNDDVPQLVCRRPDQLRVAQCAQCEMVYLPDIPSPDEIAKFYSDYGSFKRFAPQRLSWKELVKQSSADRHIGILKQTGGLKDQSLIDVGCAFGRFLQLARHCQANVMGIELDGAAQAVLQTLNIPCRTALQGDEKAGIICAFQLIEHLENPGSWLGEISKSLAEDGRLLLALPNGGEYEVVGENWLGFRVDLEHLNYFSVKTLSRLLAKSGLFIEHFWLHSQPVIPRNVESSSADGRAFSQIRRLVKGVLRYPSGSELFDNGTFVLTVLARKTQAGV